MKSSVKSILGVHVTFTPFLWLMRKLFWFSLPNNAKYVCKIFETSLLSQRDMLAMPISVGVFRLLNTKHLGNSSIWFYEDNGCILEAHSSYFLLILAFAAPLAPDALAPTDVPDISIALHLIVQDTRSVPAVWSCLIALTRCYRTVGLLMAPPGVTLGPVSQSVIPSPNSIHSIRSLSPSSSI